MTKTNIKNIIKGVEKHMKQVALERDKLDDFIDELTGLKEDCDNAYNHLMDARDALSEMV